MGLHSQSSQQQQQQPPERSTQQSTRNHQSTTATAARSAALAEFAKYIPLRLSTNERSLLTVLEQTLHVSEYTDNVDVTSSRRSGAKVRRILEGLLEVCRIATGLVVASGQERILANSCLFDDMAQSNNNSSSSSYHHTLLPSFRLKKKKKKKKKSKKSKSKKSKRKNDDDDSNNDDDDNDDNDNDSNIPTSSWAQRDPKDNAILFQTMFEIGRRNKVLNPSSMRTTYGKLMYMLQDSQNPTVSKSLGFSFHKNLILVGSYLEQYSNGILLLHDSRLVHATHFIRDRDIRTGQKLDRKIVEQKITEKRQWIEELVQDYAAESCYPPTTTTTNSSTSTGTSTSSNTNTNTTTGKMTIMTTKATSTKPALSEETIRRCIDSISDAIVYVELNVAPVQRMLHMLEENFDPNRASEEFSLQLQGRSRSSSSSSSSTLSRYGLSAYGANSSSSIANDGPTLNHSHGTQFVFVWQSLRLWCKVMRNMHRLWVCADDDLLSTVTSYQLFNTGQGLNRVQSCPRVGKVMRTLLHATQIEAGTNWVGLSVIHLGDRDVPNALVFIDKYTQIPRFLNPIVTFIQAIPDLCQKDDRINMYITEHFGSQENLKLTVLADYFKHGFDGSGDDGGSCIDGRLTSSWNWTSKVAKKSYYHALMMSGFQGFDGDFK